MTGNQINYWRLQEDKRHNVTSENETNRHNVATEGETHRHNVVTEGIDLGKLNETVRHNLATENFNDRSLAETTRHNVATEGISLGQLSETNRHNLVSEKQGYYDLNYKQSQLQETQRHNEASEQLQSEKQESEAALREAQRKYQEMTTTWDGLLKSTHVSLNNAQVTHYNQMNEQIKATISQINLNMSLGKWEEARKYLETLNHYLKTGADYVDSFVPG